MHGSYNRTLGEITNCITDWLSDDCSDGTGDGNREELVDRSSDENYRWNF